MAKGKKEHSAYFTSTLGQWQKLHPKAKAMRRAPTAAEEALWQRLRRNALGVRFRRQHPIGGYIPDFVCLSRTLVVEVDGPVHDEQADRDGNRDAYLEKLGYVVLRIPNDRVMKNPAAVIREIADALQARLAPASGE